MQPNMQFAQGSLGPQPSITTSHKPRKKELAALRIDPPTIAALVYGESSASTSTSTLSSAVSENCFFPQQQKPRSLRNMKKLSLTLPSARSSTSSLKSPHPTTFFPQNSAANSPEREPSHRHRRSASVLSLPAPSTATGLLYRKDEDDSPTVPYVDGPIQIIPGIWLGSEDNARDWKSLVENGIQSILNVAKEVVSPFDAAASQPLRPFQSAPISKPSPKEVKSTFYPAQLGSGRPAMHYLKLPWSHGQTDLVKSGLPEAMSFVDSALERGDSVLVHCQCGISRSATLVIALVMRAAATRSVLVPPEVWDLKAMHSAYAYVKDKSKWIGPNMSLIYQLLDYERSLKGGNVSPAPSDQSSDILRDDDEWGRRRLMLDNDSCDGEQTAIMREAQALDKAMEDRAENRKSRAHFGQVITAPGKKVRPLQRKRAGSSASNLTNNGSVLSEDLIEEDEEQELLGTNSGGNTTEDPSSSSSNSPAEIKRTMDMSRLPHRSQPNRLSRLPPSAPAHKSSFSLSKPPILPLRANPHDLSRADMQWKRRSVPPGLPTVPPSPSAPTPTADPPSNQPLPRTRKESRKPAPPPLHLRGTNTAPPSTAPSRPQTLPNTPSQTLFVFPPSPNNVCTPSTMTVTSNVNTPVPFPTLSTPRVATFRKQGRTRSYIGVSGPPSATIASSRVDARGWIGVAKE